MCRSLLWSRTCSGRVGAVRGSTVVLGHKRVGNVLGEVCPPLLLWLRTTLCCGFAQHSVSRLLRSPNAVTDGSVLEQCTTHPPMERNMKINRIAIAQ